MSRTSEAGPSVALWDMTELRRQPLEPERIGETRLVPFAAPGASEWMSTGDAWVAREKKTKADLPAAPGQLLVEEFYINSEHTPGGPNRIYCAIARPERAAGPVPVVLIFHGGGGHASPALALAAARRHPGMAGLAMDYNGQFAPGGGKHVTQWKNVNRESRLNLVPDLRNWQMYHYVIAARRTLDYLETQSWADAGRIGCVGISYGGWVALILAGVDDRVKGVTTGVSAGGIEFTAGRLAQQLRWEPAEQRPLWLAHYEPLAYAAGTRAGVFLQLCANDQFFWLNGASRHLAALAGQKGWVVRPNSNHNAGGPELPDTAAPAFLRHVLAGGPPLPAVTEFHAAPDGRRFFWRATGPNPITRCVLNWSPGRAVSPGRYWLELPAAGGDGLWSAEVPAEWAGLAAQAYVNIGDDQGVVVSGPLLGRDGADPMTSPGPPWPGGQLWDTARGAAAWRVSLPGQARTVFRVTPSAGIHLGPEQGGKEFMLITNSVVFASGVAARQQGLRLRLDGNGRSGTLKVTLLRDTHSLDEMAYAATIAYAAGASEHVLAWGDFKPETKHATAPDLPYPFDGLMLSGARDDGSPLLVEAITF